jgi:hypothetical protein
MEQPRNPFELMLNPTAVIEAMERSCLLAQLHSRVYRPLDRPLLRDKPASEADAFDRTVEQLPDVLVS